MEGTERRVKVIVARRYRDLELGKIMEFGTVFEVSLVRSRTLIASRLCILYSIDTDLPIDPNKKTVCIYYNYIYRTGGAETASLTLAKYLSQYYNVIFSCNLVMDGIDLVYRISEYANVRTIPANKIVCDTLILASLYCDPLKSVTYRQCIRWVHGCFMDMEKLGNNIQSLIREDKDQKRVSKYVCVGQECARQCKEIYRKVGISTTPVVIYNILRDNIEELSKKHVEIEKKGLTLVTVTRISAEKGLERCLKVAKFLESKKVDFIWYIVGEGANTGYVSYIKELAKDIPEVVFTGYTSNPYPYIVAADFQVLLSDYEAFSVTLADGMMLGVPAITTDFSSAKEIIQDSGRIVDKNLRRLSLDLFEKMEVVNKPLENKEKWLEVIG